MTKLKQFFIVAPILAILVLPVGSLSEEYLNPDETLVENVYSGDEYFHFKIYWLGIYAGDLTMNIQKMDEEESYKISVKVESSSFFSVFYPVNDFFETVVQGKARLPVEYLFLQEEGSRKNRKLTRYDQENLEVIYQKNDEKPQKFSITSPVHNEYSSFFALRILPLETGTTVVVPTFADEKEHDVNVVTLARDEIDSLFGKVQAVKVQPQVPFEGLYSKRGYPDIWLTDDEYRVPVKIKAKILIGSLNAELASYNGKASAKYLSSQIAEVGNGVRR